MCRMNSQPVHIVSTTQVCHCVQSEGMSEAIASVVLSASDASFTWLSWSTFSHCMGVWTTSCTECLASAERPNSVMMLSNARHACSGTLGVPSKASWMTETRASRASDPSPLTIVDSKRFIGWRFEAIPGVIEALPSACWLCATPW